MEDDKDDKILWKALNPDCDDGSITNNNQPHSTADGPPPPIHSICGHSITASTMTSIIHANEVRVARHQIFGASLATDNATGAVT
eukprot:12392659-Ditylum_brightwellii.AAC.1